jgi:type II secretory pathway component GspD/PulD (secretin)/tetratricopeptide (TPR) repeat protein
MCGNNSVHRCERESSPQADAAHVSENFEMLTNRNRRTNKALAAMMVLAGSCLGLSHPASAQAVAGDAPAAPAVSGSLEQITSMIEAGRLVEAKAALEKFFRTGASDAQRSKALTLLRSVDAKLRAADPVEISLQKAEFGVQEGDLLAAERWAKTVSGNAIAGAAERKRADAVLAQVATRRAEVSPLIPGMIQQATTDFDAGRYGAAKASILAVLRSGVDIDPEVSHKLETQQLKIVEIEREQGKNFDVSGEAGLGMLAQPGTVRRPGQPSDEPKTEQPATTQDGGQPPATEPAPPPSQPEPLPPMPAEQPPAAPVSAEPPPPPPAPAPSQDELVRTAMRAEAQRILTEADQAYDAARYNEAAGKYDLVIRQFRNYLDASDVTRAQDRLNDSRARLESNQPGNIASEVVGLTKIRREQAQAEYDNEMSQAIASLKAGDPDSANDHQARAGLAIRSARDLFTEDEFAQYTATLEKLKNDIGAKRDTMIIEGQTKQEKDQAEKARKIEKDRLNERDRKVNESIDRIRALQQERKYKEALQVVDQVLFLDPNNPTGLLLKQILTDIVVYEDFNKYSAEKTLRMARLGVMNEEVLIVPTELVEFPTDWPSKTFQRGEQSAFNEPRENRQVLADLASKKLPADFSENKLEDVLTYIQTLTQVPSDIDWESLEAIGIRKDTPVSLKLSPLPVQTLLDRVLVKAAGGDQFRRAGWTVDRGVLVIGSQEELNKHRSLVIYNIQDLLFDIPNYTDVPEIDLNSVLQQSQGGGGGQSPFQEQNQDAGDRPTRQEKIRQLQEIITQNVDYEGWSDNGGDVGRIQELNGSLIITNTPKNHREIVGLLSKLREIRNMQINVETKFLLVNQGWFEQIGFDLDVVINANNNQVRHATGVDPSIQAGDFFDFSGQAGTAGGTRGLQRQLTGYGPVNGRPSPIPAAGRTAQAVVNPRGWSPVGAFQNSLGLTTGLAASAAGSDSLASTVIAASPALGIAGQFLDDVQVDFLIAATQADQRSVQLTAPRLTFTNGQTANIFVVTQQAFVSDLQPIVGDSAVGFDPTVSVASEGVTMLVEGVISADRRYVTMNIDAGVARIDGFGREAVTAVAGGQLVNSADTNSFIQLPTITVTRVRTTATVPDEGTVLLGGQRLVTEVEVETGVPVLSKIPIINRFFTNRVESKEEQTLLILVKPTILIQSEQEEKNYPGLIDQVRSGIGGQ